MSNRHGVLCLAIHLLAAVLAVPAVIAGSLLIGWIGLVVYMVSGVLVIRYVAS